MTFVIAFLLGSMFGACVGFLTAGVLRTASGEVAPVADRCYQRDRCGEGAAQIDAAVPLAPQTVEPV
jgi:hypothetical protein